MTKLEKLLIRDLYKSAEGLYVFTLYRRFNITPRELFQTISNLKERNLLTEIEMRINLTPAGKEFVLHHSIAVKGVDKFSSFPKGILGPKININEFYLPKLSNNLKHFLI